MWLVDYTCNEDAAPGHIYIALLREEAEFPVACLGHLKPERVINSIDNPFVGAVLAVISRSTVVESDPCAAIYIARLLLEAYTKRSSFYIATRLEVDRRPAYKKRESGIFKIV